MFSRHAVVTDCCFRSPIPTISSLSSCACSLSRPSLTMSSPPLRLSLDPPLRGPVYFCLFNMAWTWIASLATGNVSQVDRVWTFLFVSSLPRPARPYRPSQALNLHDMVYVLPYLGLCALPISSSRRQLKSGSDVYPSGAPRFNRIHVSPHDIP